MLCNMALESGVVPEDWRSALIVPLYKGKGESTECKNYRGISLLSIVRKISVGILVDSPQNEGEWFDYGEQGTSELGGGV